MQRRSLTQLIQLSIHLLDSLCLHRYSSSILGGTSSARPDLRLTLWLIIGLRCPIEFRAENLRELADTEGDETILDRFGLTRRRINIPTTRSRRSNIIFRFTVLR